MRSIAVSVCVIALTACGKNLPPQLIEQIPTGPSAETSVYRAFVRQHYEQDWKSFCPHAAIDSEPLGVDTRDLAPLFNLELEKPPTELVHRLTAPKEDSSVSVAGEAFFIPVDHRVLAAMFGQSCSVEEMRKLGCGWLQFNQLYGSACGAWRFSHVAFNTQRNEALFRYDLGVYHWVEGGYGYMRLLNGKWSLIGVGVEFVS
jgi:hypothetical protein